MINENSENQNQRQDSKPSSALYYQRLAKRKSEEESSRQKSIFGVNGKMRILLANGTYKQIADCTAGDSILTIDKLTKKEKTSQIINITKIKVNEYIIINGILEISGDIYIYQRHFSKSCANTVHVGEYIYNKKKELDLITKLELVDKKTTAYRIEIDNHDDMCIENFLVSDKMY